MSPTAMLERSYAAIRTRLMTGTLRAGQRIDAARLADELGTSVTPIRDALNRLAGEGLVSASPGDGFHVPPLSQDDLVELLQWCGWLSNIALRHRSTGLLAMAPPDLSSDYAARCSTFFRTLGKAAGNLEVDRAMAHATDRLMQVRTIEPGILPDAPAEIAALEHLAQDGARRELASHVRRFHHRRMKSAAALLRALRGAQ